MERVRGFTLIEILITTTVMVILIGFAIVNLTGSQSKARDEDRKSDVIGFAQWLDSLYKTGMTGTNFTIARGTYPTAMQMRDTTKRGEILSNLNIAARTVAGQTPSVDSITVPAIGGSVSATPSDVNSYLYIPIAVNLTTGAESLCEDTFPAPGECRRFVIKYKLEADGGSQVYEVRSRYQ